MPGGWRLAGTGDRRRGTGKGGVIPSAGEESRSSRARGLALYRDDPDSSPPALRASARNDGSQGPRPLASRQPPVASRQPPAATRQSHGVGQARKVEVPHLDRRNDD